MTTRFTLVRHGETAWNANGRWQGHAHVPLNDLGRQQAQLLAAHLAAGATRFTRIVSSDSLRARETADALAAALNLKVDADPRLREIHLGEWQGLTLEEVRSWDAARYLEVDRDPWRIKRPGGESGLDVAERALACLEEHAGAGGHLIAVSHGGTIRNLLYHIALARPDRMVVGNTSCSVLVRTPSGDGRAEWSLDCFNAMEHLDQVAARVEFEP